ncbi:hypothetical protein T4D_15320 [Trichinella pseudospiralis]|uniref:Uncharacterized protein n=1 Tax=Trichinella pseudospiralis TaxID=6337 RepID=A0A0V1FS60_TRIPS|nr:hypothetical protein T4D_15320 [Trichinella pseudospiralis]
MESELQTTDSLSLLADFLISVSDLTRSGYATSTSSPYHIYIIIINKCKCKYQNGTTGICSAVKLNKDKQASRFFTQKMFNQRQSRMTMCNVTIYENNANFYLNVTQTCSVRLYTYCGFDEFQKMNQLAMAMPLHNNVSYVVIGLMTDDG